jgi:hypothetical protein
MMVLSSSDKKTADVFIRWIVYTQVATIALGVILSYLPTETSNSLEIVFWPGFTWICVSSYVYPVIIILWTVTCGKGLRERLIVLFGGAILLYAQTGVVLVLH